MTIQNFVYRTFDSAGRLLYVGCTQYPEQRMKQHAKSSAWFLYMETDSWEGPFEFYEGLRIEKAAIESEAPAFNARPEHIASVQENRNAAIKLLNQIGLTKGSSEDGDAWYAAQRAVGLLIRDRFPVIDGDARYATYLRLRTGVPA